MHRTLSVWGGIYHWGSLPNWTSKGQLRTNKRNTVQSALANSNHFVPSLCVRIRVMFELMKTL
jgi:hypothetical protein